MTAFNLLGGFAPPGNPSAPLLPPQETTLPPRTPRKRTWELAGTFHCSIVGTCLTTSDVRHLLRKLKDPQADTASEHLIHGRAVHLAGSKDIGGKLLNKALDKRHAIIIKRFARARNAQDLLDLWREFFEHGDISGAYWAVLSHPQTNQEVIKEVFGVVHMLSHLLGRASRADIRRIRILEQTTEEKDARIAELEARVAALIQDRGKLVERTEAAEHEMRLQAIRPQPAATPGTNDTDDLIRKLEQARRRIASLEAIRTEQDNALSEKNTRISALEAELTTISDELDAAETALLPDHTASLTPSMPSGVTLLYLGGRPQLIAQLRHRAERADLRLLDHDGGVEHNLALLPGLISPSPMQCCSRSIV